ncbi:hypothetical protein BSL78_02730 [Apostichopus japonicus]|uniref:Enoyl-CoA delta isomerase 1, mitochondrial n=1 Tax=Stichopus japonicus TaxID=307972 RepID=A0A2G8LJK5_STIJA|nr:hypothetical protein BSL78_02730 [Apostichopus japonicus]
MDILHSFVGSVAVVKLQKSRQHFLLNHLREVTKTTDLEKDERVRAMIFTSAFPGVFSAGLDIMSMYQKTYDEIYEFWYDIQDMIISNLSTNLISISAINGHCVAAGCTIPFGSDYRIMAENKRIGLNEANLGMPIPFYLQTMMENLIGVRRTEELCQRDIGRARVKAGIRENDLEVFRKDRDKDATLFARLNSSPEVQAILETTLKNLKKQKK